jgi:exodeoxyribonuclease-3
VSLIIATLNVNSIRTRLEQVVEWLGRVRPDVLALQETKVQDADFPAEALIGAGYHVAFRGKKAHEGVALVTKSPPEGLSYGLDDGGEPDEARLIHAVVDGVAIVNTYVPQGRAIDSPHFQYKLDWLRRVRAYLDRRYTPEDPVVWLGDLNVAPEEIDVYDPKRLAKDVDFHPLAREALSDVTSWGLVDVYRRMHPNEPGRYTYYDYRLPKALERNLGWRIDHIMATEPLAERCVRAWIDLEARAAPRPSDHTFLVAEFG